MNIQITELIKTQIFDCLIMFSCGTFLAVIYCIGGILKRRINPKKGWVVLPEILFWLGAAMVTGEFLYYCAYGKWSLHSAGALLIGALLSKKFFYKVKYDIIRPIGVKQKSSLKKTRAREKNGKKKKKQRV